jgi:hypothetical protein
MNVYNEKFEIDAEWVEAWIEAPVLGILLLVKRRNGEYIIISPGNMFILATFHGYDEAHLWLNEDEFTQIRTRYINDDETTSS